MVSYQRTTPPSWSTTKGPPHPHGLLPKDHPTLMVYYQRTTPPSWSTTKGPPTLMFYYQRTTPPSWSTTKGPPRPHGLLPKDHPTLMVYYQRTTPPSWSTNKGPPHPHGLLPKDNPHPHGLLPKDHLHPHGLLPKDRPTLMVSYSNPPLINSPVCHSMRNTDRHCMSLNLYTSSVIRHQMTTWTLKCHSQTVAVKGSPDLCQE